MSDATESKFIGLAMIVFGAGLIFFGGNKTVRGSKFEFMGFSFSSEETTPMSRGESTFWGIALIVGGIFVLKYRST